MTKKTRGNMYQLKINISEKCDLTTEDYSEAWMCLKSFYTLQDMIRRRVICPI